MFYFTILLFWQEISLPGESLVIDHVSYRKTSKFDPGTIRVFLKNSGKSKITVKKVLLDGYSIPVWGVNDIKLNKPSPKVEEKNHPKNFKEIAAKYSSKRIVWARMTPHPIPPNHIAALFVKMVNPLPRPMKVVFELDSGEKIKAIVRPVANLLVFTAITFSEKLDIMYLYLEGRSKTELDISEIEIDGKSVMNQTWFSSKKLKNEKKVIGKFKFGSPRTQGKYITIKISTKQGASAEERIRIFSHFPINVENGNPPKGFGFDVDSYTFQPSYFKSKILPKEGKPMPALLRVNHIFDCLMHKFGANKTRCAHETFKRFDLVSRYDPNNPTTIHLCRIRPETGFALFAETVDVLRLNPNITTALSKGGENESPEEIAGRICHFAYRAASPRPFHPLVDSTKYGTENEIGVPEEMRKLAYTLIGMGAKALLFRHKDWQGKTGRGKEINHEIMKLITEISHLKSYLAIADPVPWIKTPNNEKVSAFSLAAGDRGIVIILVRHGEEKTEKELKLELALPEWVVPKKLEKILEKDMVSVDFQKPTSKKIVFSVPGFKTTCAFLLKTENER